MTPSLAPEPTLASFGHYELRQCLGAGGHGRVYEAWDGLLHRSVALKCLARDGGATGGAMLIGEARLAASLSHPGFVKIFGFEDDGCAQYIVMELVRGTTLRGEAADCTDDPARALRIVDQVAAAMAEAHATGLVHGDLKPGNLMLEPGGTVRILDFGLARHIDPLATQTGTLQDGDHLQGTIAYMAPERLAGLPSSAATDIYALGVVLFQLVTGARPYAGLHGLALASAHIHSHSHQWPFPASVAPGMLQLVLSMTARDPAARLATMADVRARIDALRAPPLATPAATAPGSAPGAIPPRRLRGARLARRVAASVLALAVACAGIVYAPAWLAAAMPYSESTAMHTGMEALRHVDRDGETDKALASFGAILARSPNHAGAAAGQSLAYSMRYSGDGRDEAWLTRAVTAANLAVREDDQLALAHAAQSWAAALQGHGTAALAAADRALVLDPGNIFSLSAKINVLLRMQRHADARALLVQARARWPRERAFTDLEGTLLFQRGDYAGAEQAFRRSIALEPDAVLPYANLSAALLREDRGDEALAILQQGLRIQPSGILYSNLGTVLFNRADFVGASTAFERAVSAAKGGPNDYLKWANLADALRWLPGREQAAHDAYGRAMQLLQPILRRAPGDPTFLTRMGLYAAHLGNTADALTLTERGVTAAPDNPDVRFRATLANELCSRRDAALAHLARAVSLGYPLSTIESEPELVGLRRDARYQTLVMENKR